MPCRYEIFLRINHLLILGEEKCNIFQCPVDYTGVNLSDLFGSISQDHRIIVQQLKLEAYSPLL